MSQSIIFLLNDFFLPWLRFIAKDTYVYFLFSAILVFVSNIVFRIVSVLPILISINGFDQVKNILSKDLDVIFGVEDQGKNRIFRVILILRNVIVTVFCAPNLLLAFLAVSGIYEFVHEKAYPKCYDRGIFSSLENDVTKLNGFIAECSPVGSPYISEAQNRISTLEQVSYRGYYLCVRRKYKDQVCEFKDCVEEYKKEFSSGLSLKNIEENSELEENMCNEAVKEANSTKSVIEQLKTRVDTSRNRIDQLRSRLEQLAKQNK